MKLMESGQMYLETIYVLSQRSTNVRSIDIAEHMSYSKPSISRAVGLLKQGGYVVADESTSTSIPGVYAVGDVRTKAVRQIVTAVADGAAAAHFAEEYLAQD